MYSYAILCNYHTSIGICFDLELDSQLLKYMMVNSFSHVNLHKYEMYTYVCQIVYGCVHIKANHVSKDVSVRDPKRDLNYVRSHALQAPSQSWSGSAHCEVNFCSYCAVRARWLTHALMHGFSAHFQNAHARITFRKSFAFTCPRIRLSTRITIQNALFFAFQNAFQKPDLKQLCVHMG